MKTILSIALLFVASTLLAQLPVVPLSSTFYKAFQAITNPASVSGMVIWVDVTNACTNASGSVPSNGGIVNGWADQSGNNYTLVAHNSSFPQYSTTGGPNGGPCVTFTNSMTGAALTNRAGVSSYSQPNTFFIVMTRQSDNGAILNTFSGQTTQISQAGTSTIHFFSSGSDFSSPITIPDEQWFILTVVFNGASSLIRTNGVQASTMPSVGAGACPGITLGNFFNYSAVCYSKFAAVIWYNGSSATDTTTQNGIEHYLGAEFGITTQ